MPYPATVIAYAFVKKGIEEGNLVTQMKLQKMVFFAHGYHLAKYGLPLIREDFEAWKFGPVVPAIYRDFKFFGSTPIDAFHFDLFAPSYALQVNLDEKAIDAINFTWEVTKNLSANQLSVWSHQDGSPWANVYNPSVENIKIDNGAIGQFFKKLLAIQQPA